MESLAEQQQQQQQPPHAQQQETAEEAALLQQAATKWTRTAFWAAQDSAHAAMLKHQAESLAGLSAAEDDVSNSALLHLELKVACKKLVRHAVFACPAPISIQPFPSKSPYIGKHAYHVRPQ